MSVNPALPRKVLVVHSVQTSADNLNQDIHIDELIKSRHDQGEGDPEEMLGEENEVLIK